MMQRKKRKLSLVLFIALMLLFSVPLTVMANDTTPTDPADPADPADPSKGPDYDLSKITTTINIGACTNSDCKHVITGSGTWMRSIKVTAGTHTIIFRGNVDITSQNDGDYKADSPAFEVGAGATVKLKLEESSNVTLNSSKSKGAGLSVLSGGKLEIEGPGTLNATGADGAAGIGGSASTAGDITIKSGTIKARGGKGAAGIGSGKSGGHGAIKIEGGIIDAKGGDAYTVKEAEQGNKEYHYVGGPGIGYPKSLRDNTSYMKGNVTISGGTITATGGTESEDDPNKKVNGIQCEFLESSNGSANITTDPSSLDGVKSISPKFNGIVWRTDGIRGDVWGSAELNSFPTSVGDSVSFYLKNNSSLIIPNPLPSPPPTFIHGDDTTVIVNPDYLGSPQIDDGIQPRASFSSNEVEVTTKFTYTGDDLTDTAIKERERQANTNYVIDKTNWIRYIKYKDGNDSTETKICDAGKYTVTYRHKTMSTPATVDLKNPDPSILKDKTIFDKEFSLDEITVDPADLRKCNFTDIENQPYTGEEIRPEISISYQGGNTTINLVKDKDYTISEDGWKDNINIGTASMQIRGIGNFTVSRDTDDPDNMSLTKTFEIVQANLSEATVEQPKSVTYNGKEHKAPDIVVKMGNKVLTAGKDYVVSASTDNFIDAGTITYTITANDEDEKCCYTGTAPEVKFTIEPKAIRVNPNSPVEAESRPYNGNSVIDFKEPGAELVGLESRDKGEVQLMTGIIDETGSPNVGEYKKIKFDETTALTGDKAGNYKLADGQTLTLKKAVEITKLTPKHPIQPTGSYTLSEAFENRYVYTISIDKESGVSYEFSMDGGTPVNGIDDPDNPGKVKVEIPFDNIEPEKPHTFTVYSKGDGNVEAIEVGSVTENFEKLPRDPKDVPPDPVPEVTPNADRKSFDITIPKMLDENGKEIPAEYRFDGPDGEGEWGPSNVKTNCAPLSEYTCYIRYLPTEVYGPSEPGKATVKTEAAPASTDGPKYNYTLTPINPDNPDDSILSAGILENVGGTDAVTAALNAALAVMDGYNWDDIKYYDLTIMVKYYDEAGVQQERPATAADFDANGGVLPVTIKSNNLPSGTNVKKNDFAIAHMFSEDYGAHTAGEVETWENEQSQPLQKTGTGLTFNISGTSPIAIAWKAATNPDEPLDPDDPNNPNNPDDPNNPGGDDNNNQGDGNNNQGDGTGTGTNNDGTDPNNARATDGTGNGTDQNGTGTNGDGTNAEGKESQSITDALKSAVAALAPKTGDTNSIIMWVVIAVAACAAVIVAIRSKAKNGKKAKASAANKTSASTVKKSTATTAKKPSSATAKKPTSATAKKTTSTTKKSNTGSAKKTTTKK